MDNYVLDGSTKNHRTNGKKSWSELKSIVNDLRKQMSSLSGMFPMNVNFRTLPDGRTRIYFLSTPPNGWSTTLLYFDIPEPSSDEKNWISPKPKLQFKTLLEPSANLTNYSSYSREFQLSLERKRLAVWGITSYELHKSSGKIVFPARSTLFQCVDSGHSANPLFPSELRICQTWAAIDPQICPKNSDLVAYVCGGDIWVTHRISGHGERLTFAHDGHRPFADDPLSAGVPSYVMQEEFGRYQGFWWQPESEDDIYRILYEEVDESDVGLYSFPSSQASSGEYEEYRFPRAGTNNAKSKLKLVQFKVVNAQITDVCNKDLQFPLSYVFPWLEYIVKVGWTYDSKYIWAQIMNRLQQRLDLILIPLDNFCEPYCSSPTSSAGSTGKNETSDEGGCDTEGCDADSNEENNSWNTTHKAKNPIQAIYSEISNTWINIHDLLHFLEITDNSVSFIWSSEETGYRHLYSVTSSLVTTPNRTMQDSFYHNYNEHNHVHDQSAIAPRIIRKVAITSGEWEVLERKIWVDQNRQIVYFMGLRESPLEKHLYAVSLQVPEKIRLLTTSDFSYTVEFNDDFSLLLQTSCSIKRLPTWEVLRLKQHCMNGDVDGLELVPIGYLIKGTTPEQKYMPLIYKLRLSSGHELYSMVYKPHNFKLGVKYPTILNVYGGPEVQTVNNTFKGMRQLRMHMLASQGYCVVCVDSRGSKHRGVEFEKYLRGRMGTVELQDQVEVLEKLAHDLGYIDMNRIAIHGWSYGGYLSLMGIIQYPNIFKLAIAGAPVTNWELYDTGYTERYMDLPTTNAEGYMSGSVLNYIEKFPDDDNRLLIIHGLIDENVHFFHTSQLVTCLIKANKPYQLQIYPHERHSLRNLEATKHYETKLLSFLQDNL